MTAELPYDTLVSQFCRREAADGPRQALWIRRHGKYEALTWNELAADVRRTAAALKQLAVLPDDRVVLVSENRYEWIVCDLAILMARAVHVPVHASLTGAQIAYQVCDSGAHLVLVSGPEQAAKLAQAASALPERLQIVSFDESPPPAVGEGPQRLAELIEAIPSSADAESALQRVALDHLKPDDLATILYTSGTTGEPKGVMLTHRNLVSNACSALEACTMRSDDLRLTWLPLSHIFARTCDLYAWIASGSQLALAESRDTILANCAELRPTLMNGVPYFFDKVRRLLCDKGAADVPGKLPELFGGRMRFLCSGGAALPDHVARFYLDRGVILAQGYGMTEASPVISLSTDTQYKVGTVGRAAPGVEVRVADDGEVLCRGPNVMPGYWNKPAETAAVLQDGWLRTGDLGKLDDEGYLTITGRKKELIVTSAGKNVAPVLLESLLTEDPLIAQAMVLGDGRNYLTALLVPNVEVLKSELAAQGLEFTFLAEWLEHPLVRQLYAERVRQRLAGLSSFEQVHKFTLLERPFTPEGGELTPTLKLRRGVIAERNAAFIEAMYGDANRASDPCPLTARPMADSDLPSASRRQSV